MNKLTMIGTGHGFVHNLYNTCFVINNNFLINTGGSVDIVKDKDYVMHEAFCLDANKEIFKPYEKKHSTVKYVCENFNDLNIKNLILFHTEDSHPNDKDVLYKKEAKEYFDNDVIVPKDLDVIEI